MQQELTLIRWAQYTPLRVVDGQQESTRRGGSGALPVRMRVLVPILRRGLRCLVAAVGVPARQLASPGLLGC